MATTHVRMAFFALFVAVVVIQGVHVIEHVIQLVQVYVFGVPDDDALGLLGVVFAFQGRAGCHRHRVALHLQRRGVRRTLIPFAYVARHHASRRPALSNRAGVALPPCGGEAGCATR